MFWNTYGVDIILSAHANQGFHFYLVSVHGLFYQQKMHIQPDYFRFNTGVFKIHMKQCI